MLFNLQTVYVFVVRFGPTCGIESKTNILFTSRRVPKQRFSSNALMTPCFLNSLPCIWTKKRLSILAYSNELEKL